MFKQRSVKKKKTRMRQSFSKYDIDSETYETEQASEHYVPSQPLNETSSQQSSKKSASKISMKSFRFKGSDEKKMKKESNDEKKIKRIAKKNELAEQSKKNELKLKEEVSKLETKLDKDETRKQSVFVKTESVMKEVSVTKRSMSVDIGANIGSKRIDFVGKSDMFDALKRMDGLIDGENSIADNISVCSEVNTQKIDIYENVLKSVAENESVSHKSFSTLSGSDNEENGSDKRLNNSLIPNLFNNNAIKQVSEPNQSTEDPSKSRIQTPLKSSSSVKEKKNLNKSGMELFPPTLSLTRSSSEIMLEPTKNNQSSISLNSITDRDDETKTEHLSRNKSKKSKFNIFARNKNQKKPIKHLELKDSNSDAENRKTNSITADAVSLVVSPVVKKNEDNDSNPDQFNESKLPIFRRYSRAQSQLSFPKTTKSQSTKSAKQMPYNTKQLQLIYQKYQQERERKNAIPVTAVLMIIPVYLIMGMLFFSNVENWKKLDAFYFCFITITTIGFGDFIPGSSLLSNNKNKNNTYICALYIFGGLILLATVIDLISKQIKLKIKQFARKIGLSNSTC